VIRLLSVALAFSFLNSAVGEETTRLDAEKYPQETPRKSVASIVKALESRDFDYWISWLVTPAAKERLITQHGSLNSAVIFNADDKHIPRIKAQTETIKKLIGVNKTSEGVNDGVTWFRYSDEDLVLQFERQPDGRWCMNTKIAKGPAK